jgi:hypothetical protein
MSGSRPRWRRWVVVGVLGLVAFIALVWYLGDANAQAATGCTPIVDPATGGTTDTCTAGTVTGFDNVDSSPTAVIALETALGRCRTVTKRKYAKNDFGVRLYYVQLSKRWCWKNGGFTSRPATSTVHGVTGFGGLVGYNDVGVIDKNTTNTATISNSWVTVKFVQRLSLPVVGSVNLHDYNLKLFINARPDGTYTWGGRFV